MLSATNRSVDRESVAIIPIVIRNGPQLSVRYELSRKVNDRTEAAFIATEGNQSHSES